MRTRLFNALIWKSRKKKQEYLQAASNKEHKSWLWLCRFRGAVVCAAIAVCMASCGPGAKQDRTDSPQSPAAYAGEDLGEDRADLDPRYVQARNAMDSEGWAQAESLLRTLTGEDENNAGYWNDLGICLVRQDKAEEAAGCFEKALSVDSGHFKAAFNLGSALARLGRSEDAEAAYRRALDINPAYGEAYYNLGVLLQGLERLDDAEKAYRKTLKISRSARFFKARYNLGVIAAARAQWEEAVKHYEKAITMNQAFAPAHMNLGVAYMKLGLKEKAQRSLERAGALDKANYRSFCFCVAPLRTFSAFRFVFVLFFAANICLIYLNRSK
ncbi:MAG: tetratricopeptide repeat protein [Candidatus Hydrogenedentes bacterium]|nr:tetratricopeptide repeat protein [Candidatus Hydrogenedentota bacterium]